MSYTSHELTFYTLSHSVQLFLRGRPDLHQRMKRLGTLHRKTPVHKEDKIPDFYELSKTSPLPEITYHRGGAAAEPSAQPAFTHPAMSHVYPQAIPTGHLGGPNSQFSPIRQVGGGAATLPPPAATANGGLSNDQLIGLLKNDSNPEAARLAQLQMENEDLKRRIAAMEAANGSLAAPPPVPPSSETLERMKREIMLQQLGASSGGSDEALLRALKAENDAKAQAAGDEEAKRQALIAALSPQQQQL